MGKRSNGLAIVAGLGVLALAAGGAGGGASRPRVPSPTPHPTGGGEEDEIPQAVLERIAAAARSNSPSAMRSEADRLRAEGYVQQAVSLEELAEEIEAKTKPTGPGTIPIPSGTQVPTPTPATNPSPTKPAPATRDLVRGMKGEDVRAWQNQLRADGYTNIAADGDFGSLTYAATTEWQWERELTDDGIVGPKTRAAIGTRPKRHRAPAPTAPAVTPAPTKPPATPTSSAPAPAPAKPKPATPAAPPAAPKPPVTQPKPPATPAPAAVGTIPALLVNVTLRKVPAPEPVDERVKLWQDQLLKLGYRAKGTKSDGKFGPNTEKQTAALQKAKGLDASGIADPITIATGYGAPVPKAAPAAAPVPKAPVTIPPLQAINVATWRSTLLEGNKGNDVRELQTVLNRYGYQVPIDGDFGPLTHTAVVAWQTQYKAFRDRTRAPLVADGKFGKNSRERLIEDNTSPQIVAGDVGEVSPEVLRELVPLSEMVPVEQPQERPPEAHALALELLGNLEQTAPGDEDKELVSRFQQANGLNPTGQYGPGTALALATYDIVPPKPRWWPTKKVWKARQKYQHALRERARKDPARSTEWASAAAQV